MELNMIGTKHTSFYNFAVTFFLYATLIIDLYRKVIGINVGTVRNIIYILSLSLILWDAIKTNRLVHMMVIGGVMTLLYFFSSVINFGYRQVFISAWLLFVFRLWPAYYIGRYTEDWDGVSYCVRKYIWIGLLYALVAFTSGLFEASGANSSYATIAANLFYITWIAFYDSFHNHKVLSTIVCLICFVPVLFLGTRAGLLGALLALVLYFGRKISRSSLQNKVRSYVLLLISTIFVVIFFGSLSDYLFDLLPNSRNLSIMLKGDFFNDSHRSDAFYLRMYESFENNPLKMFGLVGNQIFIAGDGAPMDKILGSFAHNVYLELCMNFGIFIGVFLSIYFTIVLFQAYLKSRWLNRDIEFVFLGILGMTFVEMMVSFSWQFSYQIWLLVGMAYGVIRNKRMYKLNT